MARDVASGRQALPDADVQVRKAPYLARAQRVTNLHSTTTRDNLTRIAMCAAVGPRVFDGLPASLTVLRMQFVSDEYLSLSEPIVPVSWCVLRLQ